MTCKAQIRSSHHTNVAIGTVTALKLGKRRFNKENLTVLGIIGLFKGAGWGGGQRYIFTVAKVIEF